MRLRGIQDAVPGRLLAVAMSLKKTTAGPQERNIRIRAS